MTKSLRSEAEKRVVIGKAGAPHGLSGELRIFPMTDFPAPFLPRTAVTLPILTSMQAMSRAGARREGSVGPATEDVGPRPAATRAEHASRCSPAMRDGRGTEGVRGLLTTKQIRMLFRELADTALQVEEILSDLAPIDEAAEACKDATSALFVGRGIGATICYEGALKLKEVSYLHAEAYAAGEMKHGPIALLDEGFPVIAVATQSPTYDKVVSNIQECKARGARIVVVATEGDEDIKEHADYVIYVPKVRDCFSAVTVSVPLQLFARAIAIKRGCDVDQPRNLAKSVTVE